MIKAILTSTLLFGTAASAFADSWTATQRLSGPTGGYQSQTGIDAKGEEIAVWVDQHPCGASLNGCDDIVAKARVPGQGWGAMQRLAPFVPAPLGSFGPKLKVSDNGTATYAWSDANGVLVADKPWHGAPAKPIKFAPGPADYQYATPFTLAEDHKGDAALIVGDALSGTKLYLRPVGQAWRAVASPIPASLPNASLFAVALSVGGDVVVTWESFDKTYGSHRYYFQNFVLHAARLRAGSATWENSGALASVDGLSPTLNRVGHDSKVVLDDVGRAGVVWQDLSAPFTNSPPLISTQTPGQPWSRAVPLPTTGVVKGFGSDAAGNATALLLNYVAPIFQAVVTSGTLGSPTWTGSTLLSGKKSVFDFLYDKGIGLAVSPSGSAVVLWGTQSTGGGNDYNIQHTIVNASTRPSATVPWRAPRTLTGGGGLLYGTITSVAASGVDYASATWENEAHSGNLTYTDVTASVHQP